jgi:hypothetical protein
VNKKKQKNFFLCWGFGVVMPTPLILNQKSFLVLFFEKERLASAVDTSIIFASFGKEIQKLLVHQLKFAFRSK